MLCSSVKSKNCLNQQCTSPAIENNLCKRHLKCKNIILYNHLDPLNSVNDIDPITLTPIWEINKDNTKILCVDKNDLYTYIDDTSTKSFQRSILYESLQNIIEKQKIPKDPFTNIPFDNQQLSNINKYLKITKKPIYKNKINKSEKINLIVHKLISCFENIGYYILTSNIYDLSDLQIKKWKYEFNNIIHTIMFDYPDLTNDIVDIIIQLKLLNDNRFNILLFFDKISSKYTFTHIAILTSLAWVCDEINITYPDLVMRY